MAMDAIERVAARKREFIVDHVWEEIQLNTQHVSVPTDRRAMGVALLESAKLGVIRRSREFRPSNQPQCHANPRRVWESLVYYE